MNPTLKHLAERALVGSGAARIAQHRYRQRTLVLAYHNILPDGAALGGDRSLHLPRREFARQLDHLAESFHVVALDALSRPREQAEATERPRVVITFDDAYAGALTVGVEELRKRAMPATIFVAPSLLATTPWWDVLAERTGGEIPSVVRNKALVELKGRGVAILDAHKRADGKSGTSAALPRVGTEADLETAAAQPGITLGSHTWSHANLSALESAECELELSRPIEWLKARFPRIVSWVSYPYGLFSPSVASAAERSGYDGAFRIDGGWMSAAPQSHYSLPRLNIPSGLSIDGFRLRLAGL